MSDTPENEKRAQETEGNPANYPGPVIRPETAAVPEPSPPKPKDGASQKKRRWTGDPAMFWVTFAGVIVVIAYTSVEQSVLDNCVGDQFQAECICVVFNEKPAVACVRFFGEHPDGPVEGRAL
jgi:hypothetical protein